jgi:hypothetical protein
LRNGVTLYRNTLWKYKTWIYKLIAEKVKKILANISVSIQNKEYRIWDVGTLSKFNFNPHISLAVEV